VIRLHDTLTRTVEPLVTREPGKVSMYVCGPTVYGPPHLGHGRFALVFDVLRRYLMSTGLEVTYVSNITDIDDKIIRRAAEEGRDPAELAREWEGVWWDVMDALGVMRPDSDPHATEYVGRMVELIAGLLEAGDAYLTDDGVYLSVERVPGYGALAHQSLDDLLAGGGDRAVVGEAEKRNAADFALWKLAKVGEPAWEAPWGAGRPGWHTECVVMSLDLLGDGFDLHGGGLDLSFPHHENERAQAVVAGREFARRWVHNGFVEVGGEKMSKSLGNFVTLVDLIAEHDPRAYRLVVLQSHYRSPVEVTATSITNAEAALDRLDTFARRVHGLPDAVADQARVDAFRERMDDDLDTPAATAGLFACVTDANRMLDEGDEAAAAPVVAAWRSMLDAVGLEVRDLPDEVPAAILARAAARDDARAAKDWDAADAIRCELTSDGWVVEDTPQGTSVRRA
jgi:cysteinyl-tRNA synthetase